MTVLGLEAQGPYSARLHVGELVIPLGEGDWQLPDPDDSVVGDDV